MRKDPNEWHNLAKDAKYSDVLEEHREFLPDKSAKPAPGSRSRILIYEDGKINWEGKDVLPTDPIPELQ